MANIKRLLSVMNPVRRGAMVSTEIQTYLDNGRIPWSTGYKQYKLEQIEKTLLSEETLEIFRKSCQLPSGYGYGVDERMVEYPWLFSRMNSLDERLLDAGSVLNYPYLIEKTVLKHKDIVLMTLEPESTMTRRSRLSYMFCDLRDNPFRTGTFDTVVSLSTIEHIGMDNTLVYSDRVRYKEQDTSSYLVAVNEMIRVLKTSGKLFLSVPFGKKEFHGWLQQFDNEMIAGLCSHVNGASVIEASYFRYDSKGWQLADADSCKDCEYFDTHANQHVQDDRAAAARAVACLVFQKDAKVTE
jgi:SAM-dependent methyltransferase